MEKLQFELVTNQQCPSSISTLLQRVIKEVENTDITNYSELSGLQSNQARVVFVATSKMKELNSKYRQKTQSTDVLTFTYNTPDMLGEIFLSLDDITANARSFSQGDVNKELIIVFIHSVLHLIGHKHGEKMFALQEKLVSTVTAKLV